MKPVILGALALAFATVSACSHPESAAKPVRDTATGQTAPEPPSPNASAADSPTPEASAQGSPSPEVSSEVDPPAPEDLYPAPPPEVPVPEMPEPDVPGPEVPVPMLLPEAGPQAPLLPIPRDNAFAHIKLNYDNSVKIREAKEFTPAGWVSSERIGMSFVLSGGNQGTVILRSDPAAQACWRDLTLTGRDGKVLGVVSLRGQTRYTFTLGQVSDITATAQVVGCPNQRIGYPTSLPHP